MSECTDNNTLLKNTVQSTNTLSYTRAHTHTHTGPERVLFLFQIGILTSEEKKTFGFVSVTKNHLI